MFNSLAELENHYRFKELQIQARYPALNPSLEDCRRMSIELQKLGEEHVKDYKRFVEQQANFKEKATDRELLEKIFEKVVLGK